MNHTYVEAHGLVESYHRGRLPPDEEADFEEHFAGCPQCLEQLELDRGLQRGIKALAAEEGARAALRAGVLGWLALRRPGVQAAWVAGVLLLVGAVPALWLANRSAAPSPQLPLTNTPVFVLSALRGAAGEPAATIAPGAAGAPLALAVDVEDDPRIDGFRMTVADAGGETVWEGSGLRPNALETLLVTFPAEFFRSGDYRLTLEGLDAGGAAVTEPRSYSFRIGGASP